MKLPLRKCSLVKRTDLSLFFKILLYFSLFDSSLCSFATGKKVLAYRVTYDTDRIADQMTDRLTCFIV